MGDKINSVGICVLVLFFIGITSLGAQNFNQLDIPIIQDNKTLAFPFAGGIRAGQFSNIDLNEDGVQDLFVFDRSSNRVLTFVKTGLQGSLDFRYAPEYEASFPNLINWALLVDFNRDGVMDIFTSSKTINQNIEVWKGEKVNSRLTFKMLTFDNKNSPIELLTFQFGNIDVNLTCNNIDIPAIVDMDNDGDVDILSFEAEGSFATFYKNISVEKNLGLDSLRYERGDLCWGKFSENQKNEIIRLSDDPFSCASNFKGSDETGLRHSGSTMTALNLDGDQDMDLLLGDFGAKSITKLINGTQNSQAYVTSIELNYPQNDVPIHMPIFLATYFVDANGDGKRDLIATPNSASSGLSEKHIWLYLNEGTDKSPIFKFVKYDFLIDEMLYFNSGSNPTFADVNADGLQDIVIGSNGVMRSTEVRQNRMFLLENVGTLTEPKYKLVDDDFLGFSKYYDDNKIGRFAPNFGDLDHDGDLDLVVGDLQGFMFFVENVAGENKPMSFSNPIYRYFDIYVGQNAAPFIIDIDHDGLNDLVIGKKNNDLNFVKNIGSPSIPKFDPNLTEMPNINQFGQVFPTGYDFSTQNGAPYLFKQNNIWHLLMGSESGSIRHFENKSDNTDIKFELMDPKIGNINLGIKSKISLADIDHDGYLEMAVGNESGGLAFYNTIFKAEGMVAVDDIVGKNNIKVFPNPFSNSLEISSPDPHESIILFNIYGQPISELHLGTNTGLESLPVGIYFVKDQQNKIAPIKVIKW